LRLTVIGYVDFVRPRTSIPDRRLSDTRHPVRKPSAIEPQQEEPRNWPMVSAILLSRLPRLYARSIFVKSYPRNHLAGCQPIPDPSKRAPLSARIQFYASDYSRPGATRPTHEREEPIDGEINGPSEAFGDTPHLDQGNWIFMEIHHAKKLCFVEESVSKCLQVALGFGFEVQRLEPVLKAERLKFIELEDILGQGFSR